MQRLLMCLVVILGLNLWIFPSESYTQSAQMPNTWDKVIRWIFEGDKFEAQKLMGKAKNQLFQLKNIQAGGSEQFMLNRHFRDDSSIFIRTDVQGMDIIKINAPSVIVKKEEEIEEEYVEVIVAPILYNNTGSSVNQRLIRYKLVNRQLVEDWNISASPTVLAMDVDEHHILTYGTADGSYIHYRNKKDGYETLNGWWPDFSYNMLGVGVNERTIDIYGTTKWLTELVPPKHPSTEHNHPTVLFFGGMDGTSGNRTIALLAYKKWKDEDTWKNDLVWQQRNIFPPATYYPNLDYIVTDKTSVYVSGTYWNDIRSYYQWIVKKFNKDDGSFVWSLVESTSTNLNFTGSPNGLVVNKEALYMSVRDSDFSTHILKINKDTGNIIWDFNCSNVNLYVTGIAVDKNGIYAHGAITGTGQHGYILIKLNEDGDLVWNNTRIDIGNSYLNVSGLPQEFDLPIDTDRKGNIYSMVIGYVGWGPPPYYIECYRTALMVSDATTGEQKQLIEYGDYSRIEINRHSAMRAYTYKRKVK